MPNSDSIVVRHARGEELVDLRHVVLRAGLPREEGIFAKDDDPTTLHAGAFVGNRNVGCATMMREAYKDGRAAYRLRGMAVDPDFHRRGIGQRLLELLETRVRESGHTNFLWCNARTPAVPFYKSMGWQIVSDEFDIPTAGPHFVMIKEMEPQMNTDKHR
ncbi:MAG TPA: GNAT family N-acetyltransferase [Tepidisphaeraceae bacterium]|jgi:GNAT superfamily N-acetyltransferase|nr:GNAT family N-acetyltransferase [Tepidisphaeraceae bacterium]